MFYDKDHPNVTLLDWQAFVASETARQSLIAEVVDRSDCRCLPKWFAPLARGVAIASDALLLQAGHRQGMSRPRDWHKVSRHCYSLLIAGEGFRWLNTLAVRRCDKHEWWVIERRVADVDQILVCSFGSTPIFTRSYTSAMCLAMHCNVDNPPNGLRWIKQAPDDCSGAIEFAYERLRNEALADSAEVAGYLH
jgi:hypothetical protein